MKKSLALLEDHKIQATQPNWTERPLSQSKSLSNNFPQIFKICAALLTMTMTAGAIGRPPSLNSLPNSQTAITPPQIEVTEGPTWKASSIHWEEQTKKETNLTKETPKTLKEDQNLSVGEKILALAHERIETEKSRAALSILNPETLQKLGAEIGNTPLNRKELSKIQRILLDAYETDDPEEMYEFLKKDIDESLDKPNVSSLEDRVIDRLNSIHPHQLTINPQRPPSTLNEDLQETLTKVEKSNKSYLKNMTTKERMAAWEETYGSPASKTLPPQFDPHRVPEKEFNIQNKESVFSQEDWSQIQKILKNPAVPEEKSKERLGKRGPSTPPTERGPWLQ